jgi:type I restriction enzyme S subunit
MSAHNEAYSGPLGPLVQIISGQHVLAADVNSDQIGEPYLTGPADFVNGVAKATKWVRRAPAFCAPGDSLVTVKGSGVGTIFVAAGRFAISRQLMAVRFRTGQPAFLPFLLQYHLSTSPELARGTIPQLTTSDLTNLRVVLPPRDEQDRIVEVLKTSAAGITAAEGLGIASARRVSALTSRHLDCFISGTSREDTSLPSIRLGDAFNERAETSREDEPLLAITGERGVVPREDIERRDTSAEDKSNYRLILPGDIGYNTMRMWQGVCGLSTLRGIISPAYTVVTPRPDVIDGAFAAALFKAPHMIEWLRRYSQGIVDDTLNLKFEQFRQIRIRLPSLETQRRVANAIHAIRAEADVTARLAAKLREQKQALMTRLLSGALRVPLREVAKQAMAEKSHA